MDRYTFWASLPMSDASAALLTAAVECSYPTTLTELAKTAGISKYAASRAARPLLQAGLLRSNARGYALNPDHPMTPTVERLAWRFSGARRHDPDADRYTSSPPMRPQENDHYRLTVPESLQLGATISPDLTVATGPDLMTARDTCDWLAQQSHVLREFHADSQDVYTLWSNERLRDLIHQTLNLCGAVGAAHNTLAAACDSTVQGDGDPFEVRVSAYAWVRATYLVSAEARDVLRVVGLLNRAIWVGYHVHQLRSDALQELNTINYSGRSSDSFEHHLTGALEAEKEADRLWDDPQYGRWHHVGGTPRPQDVGTAGDQIMAVRLIRVARELSAQVATMANDPCVQQWIDANADQAHALPLIREIPDDALQGHRDWPSWPPKPGRQRARPTINTTLT